MAGLYAKYLVGLLVLLSILNRLPLYRSQDLPRPIIDKSKYIQRSTYFEIGIPSLVGDFAGIGGTGAGVVGGAQVGAREIGVVDVGKEELAGWTDFELEISIRV